MLPLLALAALAQGEGSTFKAQYLDGALGRRTIMIRTPMERMERPKISPRFAWEFDWTTAGYTNFPQEGGKIRFELYSQESTQTSKRPESVVRTLMRLFSHNVDKLKLTHSPEFGGGLVSVYLCYGGEAGGEQLYDVDRQGGREEKVNSIYLYDLRSFTDPLEAVREVAHEYGHATLPAVGGYTAPENWANGYLGEKLYLGYLADALHKGELTPDDTMGATAPALDAWLKTNVDPLLADAAANGPRPALLAGKGKPSMDAFLGLALWTARLYDERVMTRALFINGNEAKGFPEAASTAAEEPDLVTLNIPADLRSKPIWIPIGMDAKKSRVMGARELAPRKNGWVRIQPVHDKVLVRNYRD